MVHEHAEGIFLLHDFGCAFNTADKLCPIEIPFPWTSELHVLIAGTWYVPGIYEYDCHIPVA
ncbi:hypothetical protein D3C80_1826560 [compost metagenome]